MLLIALLLRLGLVAATPSYVPNDDPADYERVAFGLRDGAYPGRPANLPGPSAYRPPLYPAFLAAAYETAPHVDLRVWARILQAVLGTISVWLIGVVALGLLGRRRVALAAMAVAAVWPPMFLFAAAFLSEVLMVPLVLGSLAAALRWRETRHLRWVLACGALVGLATLTRVNGIVLLAPLVIAVWGPAGQPLLRRALPALALVLVTALTIAPWTIRNAYVFDEFIPVATEDGYTLAGTYNEVARAQTEFPAAWVAWYEVPSNQRAIAAVPNTETAWNDALREEALGFAADHPEYVAKVGWWNLRRVFDAAGLDWLEYEYQGYGLTRAMARVELLTFWPVALLALFGLFSELARALPRWLWLVPPVLLLPILITGYFRFRAPIDPVIAMLAAIGALALIDRVRQRAPG
ncbi:MAG: glycosyltransferase family 39 protein [Solirubrobacteraceae bacterium]